MGANYRGVKKQKLKKIEIKLSKEANAYFVFIEAGLTPLEPFVGANQKWKSQCNVCGLIVSPRFADVIGGGGGCKPCGIEKLRVLNNKRYPDQEKKALLIAKKAQLEPLEPYKNARTKWKCKCLKCGEIVTPTFHNLEQGNNGCLNCQEHSFRPNQPSYLYILAHIQMGSVKIGIGNSNNKTDRIKTHKRYGWELIKRYDFAQGAQAMKVETLLLQWLRKDLKLPPHLSKDLMKQFGWSETVNADDIDLPTLFIKVEKFIKEVRI